MKDKEEFEKCVICGKKLNIKKIVPIQKRKYYIEGAGQLCEKCYFKIYVERKKNDC